jgi:hypothetical protein
VLHVPPLTMLLLGLSALEQPSASSPPPPLPPGDSPAADAELEEIEKALAADAQVRAESSDVKASATPSVAAAPFSLNPDLAFIADVALAAFSDDEPLQTGGHDPVRNGFHLQQLEAWVGKAVDPYFRFDAFIVFSQFGVEIEEVYATSLSLPYNLQLRVGQFLTRFGRLNPTHPHAWDFVDQPFVLGRVFGGENNRGLGLEASYLAPLPWYVELTASTTDAAGEATARSFLGGGGQELGVYGPRDLQHTLSLKQFFPLSENWSLLWGLSGAFGPNPTGFRNRTDLYGTDLFVKYRPVTRGGYTSLSLQTEWLYRRRQIPADVLGDAGGYAFVSWRFARRWGAGLRWEYGSPSTDRSGRVAEDYLDPQWTGHRHRTSANVTFWPTEFSRLRLQGSVDRPAWRANPIWAVFLAVEFLVGAHGAHSF